MTTPGNREGGRAGARAGNSRRPGRQRGAVAVLVAVSMLAILGLVGLSIDASRVYNRKAELHGVASAAALAAARALDGTAAGVQAAVAAAQGIVQGARYDHNSRAVPWSASALKFSTDAPPNAAWTDGTLAAAAPQRVFYVKVDLGALAPQVSAVDTTFLRVVSATAQVSVGDVAVAGRTAIGVTPLAVCALSPTAAAARSLPGSAGKAELVEFGFRRGVSYDLMRLNGAGTVPQSYLVDPISPPGTMVPNPKNLMPSVVGPFVCTGTMWLPTLAGGSITVATPFPLTLLYPHLNSRFGQYSGGQCSVRGAPPDYNVKAYAYNGATPWMSTQPAGQSATSLASGGKLWTVADPDPAPASNTAAAYGPLWSYAKAVPFSEYVPAQPEPLSGYRTFTPADWPALYQPGSPTASSYPGALADRPYLAGTAQYFLAPSSPGKELALKGRRVLTIPLLACPVVGNHATVIGLGRFFMTVPATSSSVFAEFAGASTSAPAGQVELL